MFRRETGHSHFFCQSFPLPFLKFPLLLTACTLRKQGAQDGLYLSSNLFAT